MEKLKGDSLAVLEYHTSGDFTTPNVGERISYYNITGVPTAEIDGAIECRGGGTGTFDCYLAAYNTEMQNPSPCTLSLEVDYMPAFRLLNVKARVSALDDFSKAHLRYAIAESHIYYDWPVGELDSLHHVVRKMMPDPEGVAFNIDSGETFVDSQMCFLSSTWKDTNCYVVVFVQSDDDPNPVLISAKGTLFPPYVFGDATGDGITDVSDVVFLINYLYRDGDPPDLYESGDVTGDCTVNVDDVVYLISYLYREGPVPQEGCS